MSNQLNMWFVKLSFWQRVSYLLFGGWIGLSVFSHFFGVSGLFIYVYLFCMMGGVISYTIYVIWKDISEKEKMRVRIKELEEEICKHKGGGE